MSNRLDGKVALVTAAGQGIGRAIAETFAAEGARLIATDLDPNKLTGLRGKLRKLDVRTQDDIDAFSRDIAREFGTLDILVNCAGYVHQ
ncbi:MAG: SDR family NAD(P)-dependent oxidoreductase, partial [Xanthobacteraceae bacterium]